MSKGFGIVVATYPSGNSIDVLMNSNGARLSNVQVMSPTGSDSTGHVDLPDIGYVLGDPARWNPIGPATRYMQAVIEWIEGVPVCMGFLPPQINQTSFDRKNFHVFRHASDVYKTINAAGDIEEYHPSGSFVRLAASPVHEDLTGQDFDLKWAIKQNTGGAVHWHVTVANAGTVVATLDIDPSGNAALVNSGNTTVTTTGNLSATVGGTASITSTGNMEFTAPQITMNTPTLIATGNQNTSGTTTTADLVVP
jgi:hypothetical protein